MALEDTLTKSKYNRHFVFLIKIATMKMIIGRSAFLLVFILCSFAGFAQTDVPPSEIKAAPVEDIETSTDKPVEKIEKFWFVMLKTGPNQQFDSVAKNKLFVGHMANIKRLYNAGILKVAGPFGENDLSWRGIFILDCRTKNEAEHAVSTDPAIAAGLFAVEIVPWYGEPIGSFKHGKPEKLVD